MRIVIDTNIWVSGLLWRGMPWKLLRLAEAGEIELCVAPSMLVELGELDLNEYAGIPILAIRDFLSKEFPAQID